MTLKMPWHYARRSTRTTGATLDDLREAVTTLEDAERTARRVLGGAHPPQRRLRFICETREPRSAPARRRRLRARNACCPGGAS